MQTHPNLCVLLLIEFGDIMNKPFMGILVQVVVWVSVFHFSWVYRSEITG